MSDDRAHTSEEEEEDDEDDGQGINMMNFMFGNVDSHGELEGDFLDEEAKQSLGGLQNARAGLNLSDLAENRSRGKSSAPKGAASKGTKQLADTVGESDISDDEDWLTAPAETAKPSASPGATPPDPATASFLPASLATLGQPAFQDEDDYDAEEDATAPPAAHLQALPMAMQAVQAAPTTTTASAAGMQSTPATTLVLSAGAVPPMLASTSLPASGVASFPAPLPSVPAVAVPQPPAQPPAVPVAQQDRRRKASSLQQQVDQAQAAGVAFPVMTSSDGRPVLKYSDLMQKGRLFEAAVVTEEGIAAASAARVRAERLNALQAQTAAAAASSAAASAAAVTKPPAEDSDEEGFLHATALEGLPDHLRRSDSQDSDSDVHVSGQEEEEQHAAESAHKAQQEARKDKQADSKPLPRQHQGIRHMPSGLPLCQDLDQTGFREIPDADLDSIHVIQWERNIIWDDPDEPDHPEDHTGQLRGDSQNRAAAARHGDDWDDLDRALEMDVYPPTETSGAWHQPSPVLEPLPKRPAAGSAMPRQHSVLHPQMLRLDQLALEDQQSTEGNTAAAAAAADLPLSDLQAQKAQKAKLLPFSLQLKADDWLKEMELKAAEGPFPAGVPPELLLDLNDPGMTFEVLRGTEVEEYVNAAACVLPAMPKVQPEMGHPVVYSSAGAIMARFNISKDSIYFPAGKRKGDRVGGVSRLHTLQASNMSTIPLTYPQRPEMFHRPQGLWNPLVTKKLHVKNQSKLQIDEMVVKISSLVGANPDWHTGDPLTISFKKVAAVETVGALWDKAKQDKFKAAVDKDSAGNTVEEHPPLLVDRRNPFKPLDPNAPLQSSVLKEPVLEFAAIFSSIKLLPTVVANAVPSQASGAALAPPAAFQRRKDLTATEGHVVLLEYFEEYPLMLSHPGMGAKLTTYYRRRSPTDSDHLRLLKEHGKWQVGSLEALQAQEDSPFIGQLDPGKHQLAIETGMFRAPGFTYSPPPTDFLLIRNATGAISLRELTGCIAVGQQVPSMRAPIPGSRDVRETEGGRLVVHVVRDLRNKQARAEKMEAKSGKYVAPKVHVKELKQLFRNISDTTIRYRLRDKCECIPVKQEDQDGWWQPKPGARLPSEAELRRMLSPDQWCAYDSTKAGLHRLYEQGISKYEALTAIPPDRMQLAIEQLPEEKQAAAKHLDLALKTTPWTLTDNYVSRERENKGAQMAFAGPGDPTGKGRGFSFVKDTRKSMGNQAAKQKEGKLTGTAADLRRLKVPALKEKLRAAGVPEAVLQNVRRWELVDLLREVANIGEGASEFARKQRMSAAEMMQRKTRLCQEIWQRQVAVLANIPEQQQSGDTASEDDIGEELQACLAGHEEAESAAAKPAAEEDRGLNEAQQAAEDEEALRAMREEGMLTDQPASGLPQPMGPKKKLEAEPGARRMRRRITFTHPDGQLVAKEITYTQEKDQDKVTALNALYGVEAWNFGRRTIKGRTGNRNRGLETTASQIKTEPAATAVATDSAVAAEAAAAVDLTEAEVASPVKRVPSKKGGGPKKGGAGAKTAKKPGIVQICRDCNQAGHLTKKNKKCPMYSEEEPEIVAPWLPDLHLPGPPTQGTSYAQAPPLPSAPLSPPPQAAPTLKLRINPSPKPCPAVPPSARPPPQQPLPVRPVHQSPPSSQPFHPQAASQAAADIPHPHQQQQWRDKGTAAAQQQGSRPSDPEKQTQLRQQLPNESRQLEQQQQPLGPKLKKQKREGVQQGEQAQLSGGRASLKVKLGGSSFKRKESATESSASAAAPKKIKLSVKLSVPPAGPASSQPPAQSSRAAADRPGALEASEADLQPQHTLAAQARAGASCPGGSEKPHKAAVRRARQSEPSRAAPIRPRHRGLAMDGNDNQGSERRPASAGAAPQTALPAASPPALPASQPPPVTQASLPKKAVPKKKGDSGKKVLAKILGQILNGAKKAEKVTKSWWEIFSVPVNKKHVSDYNSFVQPEDEMWIKKINGKLAKSGYTSGQQFKADICQLKVNAEGYNLGGGLCAYPDAAYVAKSIYEHCVAELQLHKQEVEQAEQKIKDEHAAQ